MADETLIGLIDAYAEARHAGGCHTYNAKTAEARAKVVASLAANAGGEPVAWCQPDDSNAAEAFSWPGTDKRPHHTTPLYTHPFPPEGMVMVPRKASVAIICAIEGEVDSQLTASAMESGLMHRQDGSDIWDAAIAAAPPLASEAKDLT